MAEKDTRFIEPPNTLKQKIGGGPGPTKLDPNSLAKAKNVIDKTASSYADTIAGDLTKLARSYTAAANDVENRVEHIRTIASQVHEIRSMGGTYNYHLITKIGTSLYDFCQDIAGTDGQLNVVKAHIDALRAVVAQKIEGDGGAIGEQLLNGLREAATKHQTGHE